MPDKHPSRNDRPEPRDSTKTTKPGAAQADVEGRDQPANGESPPTEQLPPAGPHAGSDLTNDQATPGAGTVTPAGPHDDMDSTTG